MTTPHDIADEFEPIGRDKLDVHHRRQLSAMLDGELSPDEAKFMLRRLQHDGELAACWERWQVCGDVLRGHRHVLLPAGFAQRVSAAIGHGAQSAAAAAPAVPARRGIARWGGNAALAASVAAVAFFVAREWPGDASAPPLPAQPAPLRVATQAVPATPAAPAEAPAPDTGTTPSPAPSAADAAAAAALATAVAAREAPRRAAERRARAARAATATTAAAAAPTAAAEPPPLLAASPVAPADAAAETAVDPFPAPALAPPRPWPRAILPNYAGATLNADYGAVAGTPANAPEHSPFHAFAPRVALPPLAPPPDAGEDAAPAAETPRRAPPF